MSHTIYDSKAFTLTEYGGKNHKMKIQITSGYDKINLTQAQVCRLIDELKLWERSIRIR